MLILCIAYCMLTRCVCLLNICMLIVFICLTAVMSAYMLTVYVDGHNRRHTRVLL